MQTSLAYLPYDRALQDTQTSDGRADEATVEAGLPKIKPSIAAVRRKQILTSFKNSHVSVQ